MNKVASFFASFFISLSIGSLVAAAANDFNRVIYVNSDKLVPFLIFWYMLWKLFHDKKKDE